MIPAKEMKDRRQDTERRIRYAFRKAKDRMFDILDRPADPSKTRPEGRQRPS